LTAASLLLFLEALRAIKTIAAKRLIIAKTTKNSIKVNPLILVFILFTAIIL
jgi:hypothetical protein